MGRFRFDTVSEPRSSRPACVRYSGCVLYSFAPDPGAGYPDRLRIVIEIPKGSTNKYEFAPELGLFRLSQALYSPLHYPGDYGFIPGTIAQDGEPLDVVVQVQEHSFPGCLMEVRPLALLNLIDGDYRDEKILAVPARNPRYDQMKSLDDVFPHTRREIEHFFEIYKELEGCRLQTEGWGDAAAAREAIVNSRERYLESVQQAAAGGA